MTIRCADGTHLGVSFRTALSAPEAGGASGELARGMARRKSASERSVRLPDWPGQTKA